MTEPAAADPRTPKGKSGRVVALILAVIVIGVAAAVILLKLWPKAKAARIQARVARCLDQAVEHDRVAPDSAEIDAELERCAKIANDFAEVARFSGWGAEVSKREAQALGAVALTAFERAERVAHAAPPGKAGPTPELVTRTLLRALELWPEVLDDERVQRMWRLLGQPASERIEPSPALRSRPTVRRALVRSALRAGDFPRALALAQLATLGGVSLPPLGGTDDQAVAEALDEGLVLCVQHRSFAGKALEPILDKMAGGVRQARYRAACDLAAGDVAGAQGHYEQAIERAADADERTLVRGELAALLAGRAPTASQVAAALAHARAALAEPAPTRPQAARGRLMALAALVALAPEAEVAKVLGGLGPPPLWVYAPPVSPEDLVTLDRAPPVSAELLGRAAERAQVAEWQVAFWLRAALEEARLDRVTTAREALARARTLAPRAPWLRQLTVMIDALASDPGLLATPEERDRDREVLAQGALELDQLIADARTAAPAGRPAPPRATGELALMLLSRAAIALRQDLRARANELLTEASPLLAYMDVGVDGTDARGVHWQGGSGLRAIRAVVVALRGDRAELDALRTEVARDKGISEDEGDVVSLALDLSESRTADVARAVEATLLGPGPSFAGAAARRELMVRMLGRVALARAVTRTDTMPQDRRAWLLLRRVISGARLAPAPSEDAPGALLDLLRF